jgi:hypothetical protein
MSYIGFIYKWVNKENSMFYIGSHKGNIEDGYIGSGTLFRSEYLKNKNLFQREIIEYIYKLDDLLVREQYYLDLYDISDNKMSYNLNPKTSGGWKFCHENIYLVDKRNSSIRSGFENGRVIYNKNKKIEDLYDTDTVLKLKESAKKTIGGIHNRNRGDNGIGIKNSNSKLVIIKYLHGDLKLICEGTYRKWCKSGTYKKDNNDIWEIKHLEKSKYNPEDYINYVKYNGEKYTKRYLNEITDNKMVLNVHNRNYYLCTHIETNSKIISDIKKSELKLNLKGGSGKTIWKFEIISYDDFEKLKNKIKYYDGKTYLCGKTIREYCSVL